MLPLVALAVFLPSAAFCITYAAVLPAVHERPGCHGAHARLRESVVWGTLAFAVVHAAVSGAIVWVGLQGECADGTAACTCTATAARGAAQPGQARPLARPDQPNPHLLALSTAHRCSI